MLIQKEVLDTFVVAKNAKIEDDDKKVKTNFTTFTKSVEGQFQ